MATRVKAIILKRKPSGDESLYLETLLENGEFASFRIPGILKSAKRSSFHYAPGGIYDMIFQPSHGQSVIPKSSELVFSPYETSQDYATLAAVAEIVQIAEIVKSSAENAELFALMATALSRIPGDTAARERHLDTYYWDFLTFMGLAAGGEEGSVYEAYDLAAGFLTARELAERPRGDFLLPYAWVTGDAAVDSKLCREIIRRFLKGI